ncbi:MAG TPA: YqiA/YcfP family alpha/beta fold hydrolase [Vicinamibacterales bacterium]
MTSVLYFHGFASSPASAKITALRPLLAPRGIELHTPDLNVPSFEKLSFAATVETALEEGRRVAPRAMVGSSLGSLIAIAAAKRGLAVPLVLIAPAIGVVHRWMETLPEGDPVTVFNFARNADALIHRSFFEEMSALRVDQTPPPCPVTAIMGREDTTVPFAMVEERWREWESSGQLVAGSRFIEVAEGDHSLVEHARIIEEAIVEAAR